MINKVASSEIFDLYAKRMISKRAAPLASGLELGSEAARAAEGIRAAIAGVEHAPTAISGPLKAISDAGPDEVKHLFSLLSKASGYTDHSETILRMAKNSGYSGAYKDVISEFSTEFAKMADEMADLTPTSTTADITKFYYDNKKALDFFEQLKNRSGSRALTAVENATGASGQVAGKVPSADPADSLASGAKSTKPSTEGLTEAERIAAERRAFEFQEAGADSALQRKLREAAAARAAENSGVFNTARNVSTAVGVIGSTAVAAGVAYLMYSINRDGIPKTIAKIFGFSGSDESIKELNDAENAIDCINSINIGAGTETALARIEVSKNLDEFIYYQQLKDKKADISTAAGIKKANDAGAILVAGPEKKGSIANFLDLLEKHPDHLRGPTSVAGGFVSSVVYSKQIECLKKAIDSINAFYTRLSETDGEGTAETDADAGSTDTGQGGTTDDLNVLANILSAMSRENLNRDGFPGIELVNESNIISGMIRGEGSAQALAKFILDRDNYNIKTYLSNISQSDKGSKIDFRFANKYSDLISQVYAQLQLMNRERKMNKSSKSTNNQQLIRNAAETKVSYFEDAKLGLKDQLTKSYYTGLTGMYNEKPQKRTSDYKDLYGTQKETGEDLIVQSHPKSITLAESMGKGGLVENNLEQQQKSIYVATTTPSGNFQSKYAQTINYLEKLSKAADNQGKKEVSRIINQTIKHLK